ncbi:MAG: hypothetical protein DI537_42820 [Stutzerimonas stutzeri]|nr:MAG: hypothetical protein DI537_42820 [Stutzerimonas stutzeri]
MLDTTDECQAFPYRYRTRWNNRSPGRGRFPGFGMIRAFGTIVHIHLHDPKPIAGVFDSFEDALAHLRAELS